MVFSKYECLQLLRSYSQVLWLDYDVHVSGDVKHLYYMDSSGFLSVPSGRSVQESFHQAIPGYDMTKCGMSAGTFVLSQSIGDHASMYKFCQRTTRDLIGQLKLPEQAVFDLMLQEFSVDTKFLDPDVYALHPDNLDSSQTLPHIVHSYGVNKFWTSETFLPWLNNYQLWLELGGSSAPQFIKWHQRARRLKDLPSRLLGVVGR